MKAQSSMEYFIIAGMVLMFMVPIWVYISTTQQQTAQELSLSYSKNAVKQIADSASLVYSQGYPAKVNIKVFIPDGIESVEIINKTIIFHMATVPQPTEVWYESNAEMRGEDEIPTREGYYYFDILAFDTYVQINRTV